MVLLLRIAVDVVFLVLAGLEFGELPIGIDILFLLRQDVVILNLRPVILPLPILKLLIKSPTYHIDPL